MAKIKIGLACSLVLLSTLACYSNLFAPPASGPTPELVVSVDELQFEDPEIGRRFHALNRCVEGFVDDSWQTLPPARYGNFHTLLWCRGAGARDDCQIAGSTGDDRDQYVIELNALNYPQDYPEVFGFSFNLLQVPESTGWGVSYNFVEHGNRLIAEGWSVNFYKYVTPTGHPEAIVSLGWYGGYTIFASDEPATFGVPSDLPLREDLTLSLSSPEMMRDRALAQNQVVAEKVTTAIKAHELITCDRGPYLNDGAEPACTPRPFTPEEEAAELAEVEAYFAAQEQMLRAYYQEMYAVWMEAFPFDQCWPQ